jgi:hypothetical protein
MSEITDDKLWIFCSEIFPFELKSSTEDKNIENITKF